MERWGLTGNRPSDGEVGDAAVEAMTVKVALALTDHDHEMVRRWDKRDLARLGDLARSQERAVVIAIGPPSLAQPLLTGCLGARKH
jgi:hypothetical protein